MGLLNEFVIVTREKVERLLLRKNYENGCQENEIASEHLKNAIWIKLRGFFYFFLFIIYLSTVHFIHTHTHKTNKSSVCF